MTNVIKIGDKPEGVNLGSLNPGDMFVYAGAGARNLYMVIEYWGHSGQYPRGSNKRYMVQLSNGSIRSGERSKKVIPIEEPVTVTPKHPEYD